METREKQGIARKLTVSGCTFINGADDICCQCRDFKKCLDTNGRRILETPRNSMRESGIGIDNIWARSLTRNVYTDLFQICVLCSKFYS